MELSRALLAAAAHMFPQARPKGEESWGETASRKVGLSIVFHDL